MTAPHDVLTGTQELRRWSRQHLAGRIITVASDKGGIGKTTVAIELAYCLNAVLVDLDWHDGCAARSLGWRHEQRAQSPLLTALESGRTPRLISGGRNKPDLLPSGPDMETHQPSATETADALTSWSQMWECPVVVDTHPGGGDAANGASAAAHMVLSPIPLAEKELDALAGWVALMDGYPLVIVPNRVPRYAPMAQLERLEKIAGRYELPVTSPVPDSTFLPRRKARTAVCSAKQLSARSEPVITAFGKVAREAAEVLSRVV